MRSVRTIILPAVSRRDLCYASENEGFRFYQIPRSPSTFAVDSHEHGFDKPPLASYPKWFHLGSLSPVRRLLVIPPSYWLDILGIRNWIYSDPVPFVSALGPFAKTKSFVF